MHVIRTKSEKSSFSVGELFRHIFKNHIFESSAALSYYFLFSIFPLAIFINGCFSTLHITQENWDFLSNFVPANILTAMEIYVKEISLGNTATLIIVGILLTLYSMGKAIQTMKRKFRLAYGARPRSQTLAEWIVSIVFVFLVMVSFYAMLILIVAGGYIFNWLITILPFLKSALPSFQAIRLLAVTCYLFFVLLGLYFLLPGIKQKKRTVLPGTLFALVSWVVMSYLFSFYLNHFSNFSTLYGSISSIIALLLWLFFINLILLIGAYINSYFYLKKRTPHDQHHTVLHRE